MVKIGIITNFKHNVLERHSPTVPIKQPGLIPGKHNLDKIKIQEVVMHTADPFFNNRPINSIANILESTYERSSINKVEYSIIQLNLEGKKLLLGPPNEFEEFLMVFWVNWSMYLLISS